MDPSTNPPGSPSGPSPASPFGPPRQADWLPRCSVCGRQDETLRVVSYPYVVSLLVVTFRRAFSGLYCATHRAPWAILAGLITATVGWLGIPFGFIFTPVTLFQLVRGGEQPAAPNLRLLKALAEHKLQKGDAAGAARCLEACLQFGDDEAARERLRALYAGSMSLQRPKNGFRALPIVVLLAGAALAGIGAGAAEYVIAGRLIPLFGDAASLYLALLSWAPLVALATVAALLLGHMVEWALATARCRQAVLAVAVAVCAAALTYYGLPEGRAVARYVEMMQSGVNLSSTQDILVTTAAVLTRGGLLEVLDSLSGGGVVGIIYTVIVVAYGAGCLAAAASAAFRTLHWQQRVGAIRKEFAAAPEGGPAAGWAVLAVATLGLALMAALPVQRGLVDYLEADTHAGRSLQYLEEGEHSQAVAEIEEAVAHRPNWALPRVLLGSLYQAQGLNGQAEEQFQEVLRLDANSPLARHALGNIRVAHGRYTEAIHEFQIAVAISPGDGFLRATLGAAYLSQGAVDRAIEELQHAAELAPEQVEPALYLGLTYRLKGDFPKAIELLKALTKAHPSSGAAHAMLALLYYETDQAVLLRQETRVAEACNLDDSLTSYCLADLYVAQNQFAKAKELLAKAAQQVGGAQWLSTLADVYAAQGELDKALQTCDQALQLDPDDVDARLARIWVHVYQEELDLARQELSELLQSAPEDWRIHSDLSFVYLLQGQHDRALQEAEQAVEQIAFSSEAQVTLAFACQALGQGDRAFAAAEEAVRLSPKYDLAHYILGLCHADRGEKEEARAEYREFLALYWDRPYAREYKAQAEAYLAGS